MGRRLVNKREQRLAEFDETDDKLSSYPNRYR
jgi:hypothetical protein